MMNASAWRSWGLIALLLVGLLPAGGVGAAADCSIVEGVGIGAVRVGMDIKAALAITGPPSSQQASGSQVTFNVRAPWAQVVADYGIVRRISTRAAECRTRSGIGAGSTLTATRNAYSRATVSSLTTGQDGSLLSFPLIGAAFLLRGDRVVAVEVFRPEGPGAARPPEPVAQASPRPGAPSGISSPTPTTAPGSWSVRSTSFRVESGALVISGVVENRSAPRSAYAEVRALTAAGRQVGQGDTPLHPTLVPNGGSATFEVRLTVDAIPRRYTVTIHPAGRSNEILAQAAGEIKDKDLEQLASIVAQQLQARVQSTTPVANPNSFVAFVTNGSSVGVSSVTVTVEIVSTCRVPGSHIPAGPQWVLAAAVVAAPPPTPAPTPAPTPIRTPTPFPTPPPMRTIQETWSGTATIQQITAGGTGRAPLQLTGGVCLEFTSWTATVQLGDVKIGEQ